MSLARDRGGVCVLFLEVCVWLEAYVCVEGRVSVSVRVQRAQAPAAHSGEWSRCAALGVLVHAGVSALLQTQASP